MASERDEVIQLPPDGTCDACEPDEAKEAAQICDDCHFSYCGPHAEEHRSRYRAHCLREFTPQPPVPVKSEEKPPSEGKKKEYTEKRCPIHQQELTLYCREDQKIICVLCAVMGDHRQHQLITLNQAYQEMKNRKPTNLRLAMGDMVERLKAKCIDPRITRSELKAFIQKEFELMRHLVQEEEIKALHYVDLQEAVASAHVTEVLAELHVHMAKLTTEMAEITRQLNSFNDIAMEKPEHPEEESREELFPPNSAANSNSRFHDHPKGNGPW